MKSHHPGFSAVDNIRFLGVATFALLALTRVLGATDPLTLFDANTNSFGSEIRSTDAKATRTNGVIEVITGHSQPWPGISLVPMHGTLDLTKFAFIKIDLKNRATTPATLSCRIDNAAADGVNHCATGSITLGPERFGSIRVQLKRAAGSTLGGKLFGMRGYPVAAEGPGIIDPGQITQLLVFANRPGNEQRFEIVRVQAEEPYRPPTAWISDATPFFPFVDEFGQYKHKDWPGKMHSVEEMRATVQQENRELDQRPSPPGWDEFGGWAAGPQLNATGFFRVEKVRGKWWFIDPSGRLFFSNGIDCVRMRDVTPIDERGSWFENFPGDRPEFSSFAIPAAFALKGHYAGRSPRCFSFAGVNLLRKYGPEWTSIYPEQIHRRLRSWGVNTIGMWSDEATRLLRRTPYVDALSSRGARPIEGSDGYWGKFPDVFDPQFKERLRRDMSGKAGKSAGDRWCLGYFSDNEMSWGDDVSLAMATLRSPSTQPAKVDFIDQLKSRYGDVAKLNAIWRTDHASWTALLENRAAPAIAPARDDLVRFYSRIAERYFQTVREAIKEIAPQQLYLGCRFAWVNPRAAAAAAKFCDVVSYNLYQRSIAEFEFNGGADVPLLVGEFHFGALDRGMFHTGLVPVASQTARADAYRAYVRGALRHPQFVGCHWFQYQDEPVTGRVYDEENYQIGFVDVADTPYRETIAACQNVADDLYSRRWQD